MSINKILSICLARRSGSIVAIFIIAIFLILSLIRPYPFKNFESIAAQTGDDWGTYANYALDIKHNGILMPSVPGPYYGPAGFLYNYFIAACLVIFGGKSLPIFVIQHLMLGLSIALIYWTFRDKMRSLTGLAFLITLFFFGLKDVYKNYSPLLLSENLVLFTISLYFFCFVKGFEKNNFILQLMAAAIMGLSVLVRPNIVLYEITLVPLAASFYLKKEKPEFTKLLLFISVLILSSSLLLIRNYFICKRICFLPAQVSSISFMQLYNPIPPSVDLSKVTTNILYVKAHLAKDIVGYIEYVLQKPSLFFGYYIKKTLFCLGYLPILTAAYGPRTRWMFMWAGYFIYLFLHIKNREKFRMWELAVHIYIFCYYGSLILSGPIECYGFRMLIPAINFVLVFSFMALDRLWSKTRGGPR